MLEPKFDYGIVQAYAESPGMIFDCRMILVGWDTPAKLLISKVPARLPISMAGIAIVVSWGCWVAPKSHMPVPRTARSRGILSLIPGV